MRCNNSRIVVCLSGFLYKPATFEDEIREILYDFYFAIKKISITFAPLKKSETCQIYI
jgi:hypothetical protein